MEEAQDDPDYIAPPLRMEIELPNSADGSLLKDLSPGQAEEMVTQFFKVHNTIIGASCKAIYIHFLSK